MSQEASERGGVHPRTIRHLLRLIEFDRATAHHEITLLLRLQTLSSPIRSLLEGLAALIGQDHGAATEKLERTLQLDPQNTVAYYCLGQIYARQGRIPEAAGKLMRALELDPKMAESWFLFGGLARQGQNFDVAMHSLVTAIECDIDNSRYWLTLNQWLPRIEIAGPVTTERALLITALRRQAIEFATISEVIYVVFKNTTPIQQLLRLSETSTLHQEIQSGTAITLLDDELFLLVLQRTTLHHAGYEKLLTDLRWALLDAITSKKIPPAQRNLVLQFTCALAIYALTTEFVFFVSEAEKNTLKICQAGLLNMAANDPDLPLLTAISACYQLPADTPQITIIDTLSSLTNVPSEFREMAYLHVTQPRQLAGYRARINSFGKISDAISLAVREQYEQHPYPRWRFLGEPQTTTFDSRIALSLPHLDSTQRPQVHSLPESPLEVLIAGCGTGRHALWYGRDYKNARIVAVDLSRSSLAYALLKADELAITNIEFLQADLLEVPALGRQFDVIEAVGVLHHMENPAAGLAALTRCLRVGGWMKLALYSHLGRQAVRIARSRIAERGYPPTEDGIRGFRHAIMTDRTDSLGEECSKWRDFFSMSECRDLLFHVQEHQFTTDSLRELIASSGLEFMGFETDFSFTSDAQPEITDWQNLDQWGKFEESRPDLFSSMYVMWLRKPP